MATETTLSSGISAQSLVIGIIRAMSDAVILHASLGMKEVGDWIGAPHCWEGETLGTNVGLGALFAQFLKQREAFFFFKELR